MIVLACLADAISWLLLATLIPGSVQRSIFAYRLTAAEFADTP